MYEELSQAMFDVVRNYDKICCFSILLFLAHYDVMRNYEVIFLF